MPSFRSPAKVNLSLRILGRREDGFHDLETLMCPLDLHDVVELELKGQEIQLSCSNPDIPTDAGNLAWKAAQLFFEATDMADAGVRIHLDKRVPSGAGLAGGSSNAATVLLGLDCMTGAGLGIDGLTPLAAQIGSDVVFFLHEQSCQCSGRGEIVAPVDFDKALSLVLIKPSFGVSTPWAYGKWSDSRELPGLAYTPQVLPWGEMVNDLERPVFSKHLVLAETKQWLLSQDGVEAALMSGSGSTMFAVLKDLSGRDHLVKAARDRYGDSTWIQRAVANPPTTPS